MSKKYRIRQAFSTLAEAQAANFVLFEGEEWIEKDAATGRSTGRRKVGDGVETPPGSGIAVGTAFNDLPFEPGGSGGSGDVEGPASSVDGRAALFDGTTGKLLKQSSAAPVLEGDSRLTNSRTPTSHAASHGSAGSDAITVAQSQVTGLATALAGKENTGVAAAAITTHEGAADPHPQYLTQTEGDGRYRQTATALTDSDIPAGIARDSEVTAAITAHEGAADPHPGYLTAAEGNAAYAALPTTNASFTAGTNAQGQGALTADVNIVTTTAANPSGVTLPTAAINRQPVVVVNRGSNPINVYPASGAQIDTAGANNPYSLVVGARISFIASSTTQWQSSSIERTSVAFLAGTGSGVNAALAVNIGSAGAPVLFNGAGGTPTSLTLTNGTGLPIAGLTGLGTGIAAALAVNTGSAGAPVLFGGAGGTPSSLTLTNATGLPPGGLTMATARLLGRSTAGSGVAEEISIGTNLTLSGGVLSAAGGGGATNLSIANRGTTTLDVASDTGTDATIPAATTSLTGLLTSADKTKLDGIATGATANATDAALRDRATHTGTQGVATITGLGSLATLSALGNITSAGAIGSTANLPIITTTAGALTVGSFGTTANTFCQGNDSRLSDARTPTAHNQAWSTITATPTTLSGYGITDAQPLDADLTSIAALTTTTFGRSLLTQADAAATRTTLGLGTLATQSGAFSGTSSGTNTGDQTIANSSDATSHTVTLSASGGTVQFVEGANITLTTTGTSSAGVVTIAATGGGGGGNAFSTIAVSGQSDVVADSASDTLTLAAGANITLTTNAGTDTVTIAASGGGGGGGLTAAQVVSKANALSFLPPIF